MENFTCHSAKAILTWLVTIASMSLLPGCTPLLPQGAVRGPQTYRIETDIVTEGYPRNYHLHIPSAYDGQKERPLVVVVHGAFDTADEFEKITQFSAVANRENFIVLYPNGIGIFGFLQHWNAGHCCGKAVKDQIDDVGFVSAAIVQTQARLKVDPGKVFMVGFSNGGMFVHRFAAEKGALLAGAAALAGSICSQTEAGPSPWQIQPPQSAIPFLMMHAEDDTHVPFNGKVIEHKRGPTAYCSVDESVAFWLQNNGCAPLAKEQRLFDGAVSLTQWDNCTSGHPVELYAIKEWGHIWPGPHFTQKLKPDHPMKGFDAAEIVWRFFKKQSRQ